MKLWLLRPISGEEEMGAWKPRYDKCFGLVIRAENEGVARELASYEAGDEGDAVWTDSAQTTCVELTADGVRGIVMRDFHAG